GRRFADAGQMLAALDRIPERGRGGLGAAFEALGDRLRALPRAAWLGAAVVAALAVAGGLYLERRDASPDFYRPAASGAATPGRAQVASAPDPALGSPDDALLRAAPESEAERWLVQAERQLRAGRLTAPAGDNAYTSLLNAWQADREYLRLGPAIDGLITTLGEKAERDFASGRIDAARSGVMQASQLAARTGRADGEALAALRRRIARAATARVEQAAGEYDRAAGLDAVEAARRMGLEAADVARLEQRARAIPVAGERLGGPGVDMVLVQHGGLRLGAMRRLVSRDEYAAFADATGRAPARCRERASLLRVIAPRNWRAPGFDQQGSDPVTCVSWEDASAYATWAGRRDGVDYRLATASEWVRLPAAGGERRMAEWNIDCSGDCAHRVTSGASWRSDAA